MAEPTSETIASRLEVQFESLAKQAHAARFGMWIFLGSEILLFAGLFGLYAAYRTDYAAEFAQALHHNEIAIGTTNTVILIGSSFTIAYAIHVLRANRPRTCVLLLLITLACGAGFLVLKGLEYSHHFHEGIFPGSYYHFDQMPGPGATMFFTLYYFMTGLHALHMIAGLLVVSWLLVRVLREKTTPAAHTELEMGALYWHLVDCVWIFLWPLFYLAG